MQPVSSIMFHQKTVFGHWWYQDRRVQQISFNLLKSLLVLHHQHILSEQFEEWFASSRQLGDNTIYVVEMAQETSNFSFHSWSRHCIIVSFSKG